MIYVIFKGLRGVFEDQPQGGTGLHMLEELTGGGDDDAAANAAANAVSAPKAFAGATSRTSQSAATANALVQTPQQAPPPHPGPLPLGHAHVNLRCLPVGGIG